MLLQNTRIRIPIHCTNILTTETMTSIFLASANSPLQEVTKDGPLAVVIGTVVGVLALVLVVVLGVTLYYKYIRRRGSQSGNVSTTR